MKDKEAKRDISPPKQAKQISEESVSHLVDNMSKDHHSNSIGISATTESINAPKPKKEKKEKRKTVDALTIDTDKTIETPIKKQKISPTSQDGLTADIPSEISKKSFKKNAIKQSNAESSNPAVNQSNSTNATEPTKKVKTKPDESAKFNRKCNFTHQEIKNKTRKCKEFRHKTEERRCSVFIPKISFSEI